MSTQIDPRATHVAAVVAFAPNGAPVSRAFEWLPVEAAADYATICLAARRKAVQFMSYNQAQSATLYVVEISGQWDAQGKAL